MCEPSDMAMARMAATQSSSTCAVDDDRETRAEVCEECEYRVQRPQWPLACTLVQRDKGAGLTPCPRVLAGLIASPAGKCPNPDATWAARWNAAAGPAITQPAPAEVSGEKLATTQTRTPNRVPRRGRNPRPIYVHPIDTIGPLAAS
jgi:hypothetical protein